MLLRFLAVSGQRQKTDPSIRLALKSLYNLFRRLLLDLNHFPVFYPTAKAATELVYIPLKSML